MKSNIKIKEDFSFAFEVIVQIIQMKLENKIDISEDIAHLMKTIDFGERVNKTSFVDLQEKISDDVKAIKKLSYPGVDMFKKFDDLALTHSLTAVLERYHRFYLMLVNQYKGTKELVYLQRIKSQLIVEEEVKENNKVMDIIDAHKSYLRNLRTDLIGEIYLGVISGFWGKKEIESKTKFRLITGLIAIQLGLVDMKEIDYPNDQRTAREFLMDTTSGAYKKLLANKIITSKHLHKPSN